MLVEVSRVDSKLATRVLSEIYDLSFALATVFPLSR